jgi:DNA-binding response OmpR family regulator
MTPTPETPDLHGLRILVLEDTLLVAEMIEDALHDLGCDVIGPAPRLQRGLALAGEEGLDGALLDVNLAGERCFPIADALVERGVPFAFLTGYGDAGIPPEYQEVPRLAKPFDLRSLEGLVARCFKAAA